MLEPSQSTFFAFEEVLPGSPAHEAYLEARHAIFCSELGRVAPSNASSTRGLPIETDVYDDYSRHFVARRLETDEIAACVRVIFPSPAGLNVSARYQIDPVLPYEDARADNVGEISRMAISQAYRRRQGESDRIHGLAGSEGLPQGVGRPERRHQPELVFGMYRMVYLACTSSGIDYCMAAMDNQFSRLLRTIGLPFVPVGPLNDQVEPPRRPYIIGARALEQGLARRNDALLAFMTASGRGEKETAGSQTMPGVIPCTDGLAPA